MPAIYDLANRGLLPPGFAWSASPAATGPTRTSARSSTTPSRQHARTPFREEVWRQLAEGFRFVPGDFDDAERVRPARRDGPRPGGGARHRRQPRVLPVHPAGLLLHRLRAARPQRPVQAGRRRVAPGRHREAVRPRPQERPRAERHRRAGLPARRGLPDRPLPGQGDGPEPPGAALRQPDVRAGLERQLRRPRADHHGRGHRHRRSRRLLRRHRRRARRDPEPPAAAARAHRDGGAGLLRRPGAARREGEGALRGPAAQGPGQGHRPRPVRRRAGRAARRSSATCRRRASRTSSTTETYAAIKVEIDTRRWAGVPFYLRTGKRLGKRVTEIAVVFKRAPHLPFNRHGDRGARARTPS